MRVLVIDDHPKLRANVRTYLRIRGIDTDEAITGVEALEKCRLHSYGAIILDLNMPLMDGRTFLKEFRTFEKTVPVLALTSDSLLSDKVEVLGLGADDYLTKPFESEELVARIRALLRRRERPVETIVTISDTITADLDRMKVVKEGLSIELSAKEWGIFDFLLRHRGSPKNKGEILAAVWGETEESLGFDSVTLEAHISTLRKKLGKDLIRTIRNVWYVIE